MFLTVEIRSVLSYKKNTIAATKTRSNRTDLTKTFNSIKDANKTKINGKKLFNKGR
jgi:hypothetical protein